MIVLCVVLVCFRLEIMEQMAVLQETSYELLYRWAQSECRAQSQYDGHPMHALHNVSVLDWREENTKPRSFMCNIYRLPFSKSLTHKFKLISTKTILENQDFFFSLGKWGFGIKYICD